MIPEYCYDCMNRQIPGSQAPGFTPMAPGYLVPGMYQTTGQAPMQGMYQTPAQPPLQAPFGMQAAPGMPTPQIPFTQAPPADLGLEEGPPVETDIDYMQGWLRTQIGRPVKIEFLLGTNMLVDREGTLLDVGISYVLIRETETDDVLMADLYSIKFVKVYY